MNLKCILFVIVMLSVSGPLMSQTTLNPDISLIGDFRVYSHNDTTHVEESERFNLAVPSMELMVAGYLNPYARADAVIGWHGEHNAEIEELYGTVLRGLPLGMNLRVGKYLLEFGRLNSVHEHAWSFIMRPLPHEVFFGDHGLSDMAVRAGFLLPTGDAYTELMLGTLKGDALAGHHHEEPAEESPLRHPGFFGRLASSFATSESAELALGGSVVNSVYEVETSQLRTWLAGLDLKYKYKPSRYTILQVESEGIMRSEEQEGGDKLTSYGGYGYIDYRFRQRYNIGGIFEYARVRAGEHHHDDGEEEEVGVINVSDTWRAGLFLGFAPIEETSLVRLAGHWTEPDDREGYWELKLQFLFSLGPHQPHNF
ncbi:MAG: hypothetical protein AB1772_06070 [Candidatus Zixiibacteriota bacterium]